MTLAFGKTLNHYQLPLLLTIATDNSLIRTCSLIRNDRLIEVSFSLRQYPSTYNVCLQLTLARKQSIELAISVQYYHWNQSCRLSDSVHKSIRPAFVCQYLKVLIWSMTRCVTEEEQNSPRVVLTLRGFLAAGKELSTVQSVNSEEPSFTWLSCCC